MEIKDAIRQIRKELYLSQEAFARELHVGFTAVCFHCFEIASSSKSIMAIHVNLKASK